MSDQVAKFSGWAIVEKMGHQSVAGYVTAEAFGAVVMFRVVATELPDQEVTVDQDRWDSRIGRLRAGDRIRIRYPRVEQLVGAQSVYAITPCPESQARERQMVVELLERAPVPALAAGDDLEDGEVEDEEGEPF